MEYNELYQHEEFVIQTLRAFKFLREYDYDISRMSYYLSGRSYPTICFNNKKLKRSVCVLGDENKWCVVIERDYFFSFKMKKFGYDLIDLYRYFNYKPPMFYGGIAYNHMKIQADFIQQHLIPVIKGEVWVDELIKKQ